MKAFLAVAIGGALGTLLRWWLNGRLNALFPIIPPGTLAANLIAAYLIGASAAFFASLSAIAPEWRLFVMTGFCGGLSTFSTFSAEVITLMRQNNSLWALAEVGIHLSGSLLMTFLGMGTVVWLLG